VSGINQMPLRQGMVQEGARPGISSGEVARRLIRYFRPHVVRLVVALVAMACVAAITAGAMWILKQVIDRALMSGDLGTLRDVVYLLIVMYFMKAVLAYVHDYMTAYIGNAIVRRMRDEAYGNIHSLSLDFTRRMIRHG
jgi:ABC-type multidrug transport system fused ATPase/permease subunit